MKNIFAMTAALLMGFGASANNVELVVEAVDNGGLVPGNTYRVYAVLPSAQHSLHAVFAADEHILSVATTGTFFQHQYGSATTETLNEAVIGIEPTLAFDSWVTVGSSTSSNNGLFTTPGLDFSSFLSGNELTILDGAWFVIPSDVNAQSDAGNKVLLMQLTTDGVASGVINVQYHNGVSKATGGFETFTTEYDLTFSTENAEIFGCTDSNAANYSTEATYDDGSCEGESTDGITGIAADTKWSIFPNPISDPTFSVKFDTELVLGDDNIIVEATDMNGKIVLTKEYSQENVIGGNRLVIAHELAAGTYTLSAKHRDYSSAQNFVVIR